MRRRSTVSGFTRQYYWSERRLFRQDFVCVPALIDNKSLLPLPPLCRYSPGIRCDQVETKDETDGRKIVEEAMTKATIRTCPRPGCGTKFCKSDGCNKMTCPKCRTLICYICRNEIPKTVAYGHFCQTPHCRHDSCKKCPLYTNNKEDDKRAVREAGLNAAKSVKGKKQVNVDVDSLLKDPLVA